MHALEKEMATHSSILAWRIPGMEEPVGLHEVGHDWSDLAAAAVLKGGLIQPLKTAATKIYLVIYSLKSTFTYVILFSLPISGPYSSLLIRSPLLVTPLHLDILTLECSEVQFLVLILCVSIHYVCCFIQAHGWKWHLYVMVSQSYISISENTFEFQICI